MLKGSQLTLDALEEDGLYDCDRVAFHAVFQCLVIFIEQESDGVEAFEAYVKWCHEGGHNNPGAQQESLDLYRWYKEGSWRESSSLYDNRSPKRSEGVPTGHDQLKRAVAVMGSWWT